MAFGSGLLYRCFQDGVRGGLYVAQNSEEVYQRFCRETIDILLDSISKSAIMFPETQMIAASSFNVVRGRSFRRPAIKALILGLIFCVVQVPGLFACVMSAMISSRSLSSFPAQGLSDEYTAYNDPWDYFGFVMANSRVYSNSDGYGTVAYNESNLFLGQNQRWYKRVTAAKDFGNKFYTGRYPDSGGDSSLWNHDVLDRALYSSLSGGSSSHTIMIHGRSASAVTFGNHPFVYQLRDRSLAFMHNGNCVSARNYMIQRIREINPYENWFLSHPSDYIGLTYPYQWVDSELMFHFIVNHILLKDNDVLAGIGAALWELMPWMSGYGAPSFNFIMADGERLYAFRNTPVVGSNSHYKLSYKGSETGFWAIRTLYPQPGDVQLQQMELVAFNRIGPPQHYPGLIDLHPIPLGSVGNPTHPGKATPSFNPGLFLYPNPLASGSEQLNLKLWMNELSGRIDGSVSIYNMRAQLVYSSPMLAIDGKALLSLNLPKLSAGLYLCSVRVGSQVKMAKFSILDRQSR